MLRAAHQAKSFSHGKLLLRRALRELSDMERLAALSGNLPLTNDGWRILLLVLVLSLKGTITDAQQIAQTIGLDRAIVERYLNILAADRLVLLDTRPGMRATIADEGLLRVARFFLPLAANEP